MFICGILLTGCIYQEISEIDILKAVDFCKDKGGLESIQEGFETTTKFICINGDRINEKRYNKEKVKELIKKEN
jgi:hypothetical protein